MCIVMVEIRQPIEGVERDEDLFEWVAASLQSKIRRQYYIDRAVIPSRSNSDVLHNDKLYEAATILGDRAELLINIVEEGAVGVALVDLASGGLCDQVCGDRAMQVQTLLLGG